MDWKPWTRRVRHGRWWGLLGAALIVLPGSCPAQAERNADLVAQGSELYNDGHFEEAVTVFRAALTRASGADRRPLGEFLARSLSALGVELFNAGESRQAEAAFREALEHGKDFFAHFGLGFLHLVRLEDDDAGLHLQEAGRLEPDHAKTHKLRALLEYRRGDVAAAVVHMTRARELEPDDKEAGETVERWQLESRYVADFRAVRESKLRLRLDPELDDAQVAHVRELLRRTLAELKRELAIADHGPLVVVVFADRRFHQATGSHSWVGGLYDGQLKVPFPTAGDSAQRAELEATVRHEVAHFLIQVIAPECPSWLNEGLAQLLENRHDPASVRKLLREQASRRSALREIPARLWEIKDVESARWTYLQGLGFADFLSQRFQRFRLVLLLDALTRTGSLSRSFELTYGLSLEALEGLWWTELLGASSKAR